MDRVNTPDRQVNKFGTGKDGYKDGVAPASASTSTDADIFDAFQEEIIRVVEGSGEAPARTDLGQMIDAVRFFGNVNAFQNLAAQTGTGTNTESVAADAAGGDGIVIMGSVTNGQRSTDGGFSWSSVTGQSQNTSAVAHGNNQFVATGSGSINIQSSTTGVTWISESTGTGSGKGLVYDSAIGLWCVVGDDTGSWIVTSPDGLAWTVRSAAGSNLFNGVASNGTVFVAVGANGAIESSTDGITWAARTAAGSYAQDFNGVTWTGKVFVAVGDASASDGELQTSPDGITWTQLTATAGLLGNVDDVFNVGGVIVAIETSGANDGMRFNHGNCGGPWLTSAGALGSQLGTSVEDIAFHQGRPIVTSGSTAIHTAGVFIGT